MPKNYADEQERLILRISECEEVIHNLENNKAWQIVQRDMEEGRKEIDANWQLIWDNDKLLAARVLKFAYEHVLCIKDKYKEDLKQSRTSLKKLENPKTEIVKDYDNE